MIVICELCKMDGTGQPVCERCLELARLESQLTATLDYCDKRIAELKALEEKQCRAPLDTTRGHDSGATKAGDWAQVRIPLEVVADKLRAAKAKAEEM